MFFKQKTFTDLWNNKIEPAQSWQFLQHITHSHNRQSHHKTINLTFLLEAEWELYIQVVMRLSHFLIQCTLPTTGRLGTLCCNIQHIYFQTLLFHSHFFTYSFEQKKNHQIFSSQVSLELHVVTKLLVNYQ